MREHITAYDVWYYWLEGMLFSGREVSESRKDWLNLSEDDKKLDEYIAAQLEHGIKDTEETKRRVDAAYQNLFTCEGKRECVRM